MTPTLKFRKLVLRSAPQVLQPSKDLTKIKPLTSKYIRATIRIQVRKDVRIFKGVASELFARSHQAMNDVPVSAVFGPVIQALVKVLKVISKCPALDNVVVSDGECG